MSSHENNIININLEIDDLNENDNQWEIEYIDDSPIEEDEYIFKPRHNYVHSEDEEEEDNSDDADDKISSNYFRQIIHIDDEDINFKEISLNDDDMNPNHSLEIKNELKEDYMMFVDLVKQQNNIRVMMLKRVLKSYIKKEKTVHNNLSPTLIFGINKISDVVDLENMVGAILADILFDNKMIKDNQIKAHRHLILPFVSNSTAQDNFLNQIVLILFKYDNLVEPDNILEIFTYIKNHLVNKFVLINWYNSLNEPSDDNHLSQLKSAIHCFLCPLF
jgi:hypothetical protein